MTYIGFLALLAVLYFLIRDAVCAGVKAAIKSSGFSGLDLNVREMHQHICETG